MQYDPIALCEHICPNFSHVRSCYVANASDHNVPVDGGLCGCNDSITSAGSDLGGKTFKGCAYDKNTKLNSLYVYE